VYFGWKMAQDASMCAKVRPPLDACFAVKTPRRVLCCEK
jgi:hypothetical protein